MADETINQQTEDTSPSIDDFLLIWDNATSTTKKVSLTSLAAVLNTGGGIWWQELGRHTPSGSVATLSVTPIATRKYLMVLVTAIGSGATAELMRFNNDSAANYVYRRSVNGGADAVAATTGIDFGGDTSQTAFIMANIVNISASEKIVTANRDVTQAAGAGTQNARLEMAGKWANTAAAITRVDYVTTSNAFAVGSQLIVLGHD